MLLFFLLLFLLFIMLSILPFVPAKQRNLYHEKYHEKSVCPLLLYLLEKHIFDHAKLWNNPFKGALCSCGEEILIWQERFLSFTYFFYAQTNLLNNKLNRQTDIKGRPSLILFYLVYVADPVTFLASVFLGPYFPLSAACLPSYRRYVFLSLYYYFMNINTSLKLHSAPFK